MHGYSVQIATHNQHMESQTDVNTLSNAKNIKVQSTRVRKQQPSTGRDVAGQPPGSILKTPVVSLDLLMQTDTQSAGYRTNMQMATGPIIWATDNGERDILQWESRAKRPNLHPWQQHGWRQRDWCPDYPRALKWGTHGNRCLSLRWMHAAMRMHASAYITIARKYICKRKINDITLHHNSPWAFHAWPKVTTRPTHSLDLNIHSTCRLPSKKVSEALMNAAHCRASVGWTSCPAASVVSDTRLVSRVWVVQFVQGGLSR